MKKLLGAALALGMVTSSHAGWVKLNPDKYTGMEYSTHSVYDTDSGLVIYIDSVGRPNLGMAYNSEGCEYFEEPMDGSEEFYLNAQLILLTTQCVGDGIGFKIPFSDLDRDMLINECKHERITRLNSYEHGFKETFNCKGFNQRWRYLGGR